MYIYKYIIILWLKCKFWLVGVNISKLKIIEGCTGGELENPRATPIILQRRKAIPRDCTLSYLADNLVGLEPRLLDFQACVFDAASEKERHVKLFLIVRAIKDQSGIPRWFSDKECSCQSWRHRRHGFDPWVRKIPWRRKCQPTPAFLPGESHGQNSLAGYSPCNHRVRHD